MRIWLASAAVALIVGTAIVGAIRQFSMMGLLSASYYTFFGCLALAAVLVFIGESRLRKRISEKAQKRMAWVTLLSCYGACVGIVAILLGHFFHLHDWVAIAVAVPLGLPALAVAAKISEG